MARQLSPIELDVDDSFFLTGEIRYSDALKFNLHLSNLDPSIKSTWIIVNSPGGEFSATMSIIESMKRFKGEVNVYVTGSAFSGAFLILLAASKRYGSPFSEYMAHDVRDVDGDGNHSPIDDQGCKIGIRYKKMLRDHLKKFTRWSDTRIEKELCRFHSSYYTPEEARKLKFINNIRFFKLVQKPDIELE